MRLLRLTILGFLVVYLSSCSGLREDKKALLIGAWESLPSQPGHRMEFREDGTVSYFVGGNLAYQGEYSFFQDDRHLEFIPGISGQPREKVLVTIGRERLSIRLTGGTTMNFQRAQ